MAVGLHFNGEHNSLLNPLLKSYSMSATRIIFICHSTKEFLNSKAILLLKQIDFGTKYPNI